MSGQLSPELGRLHRLKCVDLGGAVALTGNIETLRNATLLEKLNLSHSQVPWQRGCMPAGLTLFPGFVGNMIGRSNSVKMSLRGKPHRMILLAF